MGCLDDAFLLITSFPIAVPLEEMIGILKTSDWMGISTLFISIKDELKDLRYHGDQELAARLVKHDMTDDLYGLNLYTMFPDASATPQFNTEIIRSYQRFLGLGYAGAIFLGHNNHAAIPVDSLTIQRLHPECDTDYLSPEIYLAAWEIIKNASRYAVSSINLIGNGDKVEITDDGPGVCDNEGRPISLEGIPLIFKGNTTKRLGGGFGLRAASRIMDIADGSITVRTCVGENTIMYNTRRAAAEMLPQRMRGTSFEIYPGNFL